MKERKERKKRTRGANFKRNGLEGHYEYRETLNETLANYENLEAYITEKHDQIKSYYTNIKRYKHWRGADVIVTSETHYVEKKGIDLSGGDRMMMLTSPGDADVVVVTGNPGPIVWMLYKLRDNSSGYLNFRNKYMFYGRVAEAAGKYLEDAGTGADDQALMLACLEEAGKTVSSVHERINGMLERFDSRAD